MRRKQFSADHFNAFLDAQRAAKETGQPLALDPKVLRKVLVLDDGWEACPVPVTLASNPTRPTIVIPPKTLVMMTTDGVSAFTLHWLGLPWLDSTAVFFPKSIREPFLGDLREDLAAMADAGRSTAAIRWAAISQITLLMLRCVVSIIVRH